MECLIESLRQRMEDPLPPTGKRAIKQSTQAVKEKQQAKNASKSGTRASDQTQCQGMDWQTA